MESSFLMDLLTLHGPLGFGWIGFVWSLWRNSILQERVFEAFVADTEAKVQFTQSFEKLTTYIQQQIIQRQ